MANQFPIQSKLNRQQAILNNEKTYEGVACKVCGSTKKYVSGYSCVCCNIKRNKHKLYDDELMAKYRTKEKSKLYWNTHKEVKRKKDIKYSNTIKGKLINNLKSARRRARIKNQLPKDANFEIIKQIYEQCQKISIETGILHEVDHIIPIHKGGLHHQNNLQILTRTENRKKGSNIL